MAEDTIILRVENYLSGLTGIPQVPNSGAAALPSTRAEARRESAFTGGISAQLFVSGLSQVIGATGNQQVAGIMRQGAEWGFLFARAASLDVTAAATAGFKLAALALQKWNEYKEEKKETAKAYNALTILQLQTGQYVITSNTITSYDKWGKVTFRERR